MVLHVQLKQHRSPGQTPLKQQENRAGVAEVRDFHHQWLKRITLLKNLSPHCPNTETVAHGVDWQPGERLAVEK